MTDAEKTIALLAEGYTIGQRDPRINTDYTGKFMVVEGHELSELPTKDGRNGPWAVVGDDLWILINQAWDFHASLLSENALSQATDRS